MQTIIKSTSANYLEVIFEKGEKIIAEKGIFLYSSGEYSFENKVEVKNYRHWLAKIVSGKSLTYNIYTAQEPLQMLFAPKDSAQIFNLSVHEENPIFFEPYLHLARTIGLELRLESKDLKTTLNDGLKLRTVGTGELFLKAYGQVIEQVLDTEKPVYIDEDALIAFEASLMVKTISRSLKEWFSSGEGFLFAVSGKGKIWLQSRKKTENTGGEGIIGSIINIVK